MLLCKWEHVPINAITVVLEQNNSLGTNNRLLWTAWLLVTSWITFNLVNHGLWLDEGHTWCIVRDSGSIGAFAENMRNEGHPWLWHALLWPLAAIGLPAWSIQALHGAIAVATCGVILFRSPFPIWARVLLVSGYFFVFEYAALSRNYALGVLLLLIAAYFKRRGRRDWQMTVLLVLLAQTHLWATCLVSAWTLLRLVERKENLRDPWAMGAILLSCALAFACVLPADHLVYGPELDRLIDPEHLKAVGRMLTRVFVPIPDFSADQPWNTSILTREKDAVANWAGPLLWVALLFALPLSVQGRVRFVLGSLAVMAFPLLAPFQAVRYAGPLLVVGIAACWTSPPTITAKWSKVRSLFIGLLLVVQTIAGISMSWLTAERPFSMARASVQRIVEEGRPDLPVVVDRYDAGAPASAYLGRPVYYPERSALGSFCLWFPQPHDPTEAEVMKALVLHEGTGCYLLAKDTSITEKLGALGLSATILGTFTGGMIQHDDHVVMRIDKVH